MLAGGLARETFLEASGHFVSTPFLREPHFLSEAFVRSLARSRALNFLNCKPDFPPGNFLGAELT